jgi:hypothetical protein
MSESGAHGRLAALDDYASGQMPDDEAARFEEDLFAAAAGGADGDARFLDWLTRSAAWLCRYDFAFRGGSTRAQVDNLVASGKNVFIQDFGPGGPAELKAWSPETEFVVTRLGVDLRGYREVEVDVSIGEGPVIKTFRECDYDPTDGALYAVCHEPLARLAFQHPRVIARVSAVKDAGRETVAVYDARATV